MLILAKSLRELRFGELMSVYEDTNLETAILRTGAGDGFALQQAELDFWQYLREVFFRTPGAVYALWEAEGQYASALRLEPYRDGLILSALETAPLMRKKGFAEQLIRGVQRKLPELGFRKLYTHVKITNIPSRNIHEKCGFRMISNSAVYLDGSVDHRAVTLVFEP